MKPKHSGGGFFTTTMTDAQLRAYCEENGLDYEWQAIKSLDAQGKEDEARALYEKRVARKKADGSFDRDLNTFLECWQE